MISFFVTAIPFSKIRHNDLEAYVEEGFGGKKIEYWPPSHFIKEYVKGNKDEAQEKFSEWYYQQLQKYHSITKDRGGMYQGSLYKLIESISGTEFNAVEESTIKKIIQDRVQQRFLLVDKILKEGYKPGIERIDANKKNGKVYLKGGHHRAAILLAVGYNEMPGVLVFPSTFVYKCFLLVRKIKNYVSF